MTAKAEDSDSTCSSRVVATVTVDPHGHVRLSASCLDLAIIYPIGPGLDMILQHQSSSVQHLTANHTHIPTEKRRDLYCTFEFYMVAKG
jgi:hypothetical protein